MDFPRSGIKFAQIFLNYCIFAQFFEPKIPKIRVKMGKIEKEIDKSPFKGKMLSAETKGFVKRIRCKGCDHSFDATFFRKNPDPNSAGCCPVCSRCDFEFVVRVRRR